METVRAITGTDTLTVETVPDPTAAPDEVVVDVVAAGVTVHSGGAYGIDGAAHRAALMSDGATVAWLAGGVDRMYPIGHAHLADRIASAAGSALVSEVAPGASPTRWR